VQVRLPVPVPAWLPPGRVRALRLVQHLPFARQQEPPPSRISPRATRQTFS
jgi:hypothetical protein